MTNINLWSRERRPSVLEVLRDQTEKLCLINFCISIVMEMVIYQYSNCWVILSGSIALISLTGSITLMDILSTMIQEYSGVFLFAAPFRQGVTRTCEPSCEGPGTQVYEVFLRRFMSILASFVQEANVQFASC